MLDTPWMIALSLNTFLIIIAFILPKKLLTPIGYLHAWLLGVIIWGTLQWQGYTIVLFYFFVGSAVTKIKMKEKEAEGIAEKRSGERSWENVWGSALISTICAILVLILDPIYTPLLTLGYVASFSTKLSDTTASEIGKAYGKNTFLITTFKPVSRGTEGAVSLEGTMAGIVASLIIAGLGYVVGLVDLWGVLWCIIAAFVATNLESVIGATLQTKISWLTNEVVNIINTCLGAVIAILLGFVGFHLF